VNLGLQETQGETFVSALVMRAGFWANSLGFSLLKFSAQLWAARDTGLDPRPRSLPSPRGLSFGAGAVFELEAKRPGNSPWKSSAQLEAALTKAAVM
jgi:hypothetical protein